MNPEQDILLSKIILQNATAADFSAVTNLWAGIYSLFENYVFNDTLVKFGYGYTYTFDGGIYIFHAGSPGTKKGHVYKIYHADWDKTNYFVRFPDDHIEEIV